MNKQIFLFLAKSLKVIVCLFLVDLMFGEIHRYVFNQQQSGKFYRINYTMDRSVEDVVVFGSSHAAAHYVPDVLERELGLSCYNAGVAGQQILVHGTLQEILLQRTTPKMMILDIDVNGFYQDAYDYGRLSDLHPFYYKHREAIGRVLALKSGLTEYFLVSKLYQYNSTIVHILKYWIAPQRDRNGYQATFLRLQKPPEVLPKRGKVPPSAARKARGWDKNLLAALERFISQAERRNVRLIWTISPNLEYDNGQDRESLEKIRSLADRHEIKIFDFTNSPAFLGHDELFVDAGHLNDAGARIFSKMVADKIRQEFPDLNPR